MFELENSTAEQSETIKKLIKEMGTDGAIPLDNVTGSILRRVIKYCRMHASAADEADEVRKWDKEFVKVNLAMLFDLILVYPLSVCLFYFSGKNSFVYYN
ncbi:SKP1-like protein 4 [Linum grandiflorum]